MPIITKTKLQSQNFYHPEYFYRRIYAFAAAEHDKSRFAEYHCLEVAQRILNQCQEGIQN